jgi:hypothetical protein
MMEIRGVRPNMPEYPDIATHIREAIAQVYNGTKDPEQALDEPLPSLRRYWDGRCSVEHQSLPNLICEMLRAIKITALLHLGFTRCD